ncbi:hypothetical protein [Streptomyces sp. IBSBF 2394]|uniref:hypothetical protein n=1 Tax=Streptomyces sp. IBSBF 2394 TaxID=2903532 RepID=UPI002FDBF649
MSSSATSGTSAYSPSPPSPAMRQELPLHSAHVEGFTRLMRDALGSIGGGSGPGEGNCCHCGGTGLARPLWKPSLSAGYDVA